MTSLVETKPFTEVDEINTVYTHIDSNVSFYKSRVHKHILKSKENTYKHKCNKLLKRKLKKYKLRQDGTEDQDVLNVSKILLSSLTIKSPNSVKNSYGESDINYFEELRPRNYLFKMVRRKVIKVNDRVKSPNINIKENETIELPEAISSQERKHTNAFQLLMDSRNKSIGSNSPGKERNHESESEEVLEKKTVKAKRNLALQKMAEAKGSLKYKELEEQQDKIIKKKMDKRAERLKNMILKETKSVKLNEDTNRAKVKETVSPNLNPKDKSEVTNKNGIKKQSKAWQIVDIFNTMDDPINVSPEKKHIPKEDREFLKKLSPSIKKKESMLSYFKKVDKDSESPVDSENDNLIKVKLQVKTKKRGRKKKLSLKRDTIDICDTTVNDENNEDVANSNIPLPDVVPIVEDSEPNNVIERQKRKRISKMEKVNNTETENIAISNENRPKRSIKRPVKYTDDGFLSSSDEDMHIFTPKKKKHIENDDKSTPKSKKPVTESLKTKVDTVNVKTKVAAESVKTEVKKTEAKDTATKKPTKLAPIFASKQLDAAALEAKQKFLQSGVPDKLKKIIQQQKSIDKISGDFPVVTHVQQNELVIAAKCEKFLNLFEEDEDDHVSPIKYETNAIQKLLDPHKMTTIDCTDNPKKSTQAILQSIKQLYPKFPVYRTYSCLRGKRKGELKDYNNVDVDNSIEVMNDVVDVVSDSPDKLNWTDKYKATSTKQIIGNFESLKELRKWLVSWSENEAKSKSKRSLDSDSSDFYHSETDSRESLKTTNNLLMLTGPTGCGKTSSVYAVAAELAMKVIEVNASSKRTGKIMLQDLQEATQSHKVNRGTSNSQTDNSQKSSQEKSLTELLKNNRKRGRPKKLVEQPTKKSLEKTEVSNSPSSQESTRTDMSLILIDDADIVFDQDDGFTSAIVQLVQCSKRPVILITSSLICPHLQRFLQTGKVLKMYSLLPRLLGTWLDIMCLADCGIGWPGVGEKFLNYFKGDIRKTINYLQFYIASYAHNNSEEESSQNVDCYKSNIDDESSSMSWVDSEYVEGRKLTSYGCINTGVESNVMWTEFVEKYSNMSRFQYPMQLFNIWWSVPRLLKRSSDYKTKKNIKKAKMIEIRELEAMANVAEAISISDFITQSRPGSSLEISSRPWYFTESDSVSEEDYIDYYTNKYVVGDEICHTMVTGSIAVAQEALHCHKKTDISFPGMPLQREKDRIISRHNSLTSYLSPWSTLDRRSLALDYWSSCRTICRLEKNKNVANLNTKRNNRFCHYLKSLNVLCKSDTFDNLCHSLSGEGTQTNITNFNE